jgi:hypothetical protein
VTELSHDRIVAADDSLSFNQVTSNAALNPDVVTQKMRWFKNIKRQPFDAGQESLDYSLQPHDGIENLCVAPARCREMPHREDLLLGRDARPSQGLLPYLLEFSIDRSRHNKCSRG